MNKEELQKELRNIQDQIQQHYNGIRLLVVNSDKIRKKLYELEHVNETRI